MTVFFLICQRLAPVPTVGRFFFLVVKKEVLHSGVLWFSLLSESSYMYIYIVLYHWINYPEYPGHSTQYISSLHIEGIFYPYFWNFFLIITSMTGFFSSLPCNVSFLLSTFHCFHCMNKFNYLTLTSALFVAI